ncbi:MAG TPA: glycosyltransferase family 2 protein [Thermoanaerobaculia bacterium]|nr:glycosyltransferase family 2 protein [Thermoanaerobaculia bacterium]
MSVVVVAGNHRARLRDCLASVLAQEGAETLEVLVVDCASEDDDLAADFPNVRRIRPVGTPHYGEALALGVQVARAPVIAFIEEHARARPGWARALIEIHRGPWAAAACEVHSANPELGLSDGWGLMGYGMWYPPLSPGETEFVHGYNSACKREVLLSYGERLPRLLLADTAFAHRLRLDGHRLVNAPGARIEHLNETELLLPLRKNLLAHRFSAPARADECGWTVWRRLAYLCASPLLPLYGLWCQARRYRGRPELKLLMRILPHYVVAHLAIAAGMMLGLALGPGDAARQFTRLELDNRRPEA